MAEKWQRIKYMPGTPLGRDGLRATGSKEHIELSRKAATEGMVLIKNEDEILPLKRGAKVAIFGKAQADYVKGGGGSGDVIVEYVRQFCEGMVMKAEEGKISFYKSLTDFYAEYMKKCYEEGKAPGEAPEPYLDEALVKKARDFADIAIVTICRYSAENYDRTGELYDGDFYLSHEEDAMVKAVLSKFDKVIVVLNTGGMMDTGWIKNDSRIKACLIGWQAGMEGGLAQADILVGDAYPSGRLTDTFAENFDAYPSSENFNESDDYVEYSEDIYVGYRYFETIPGAAGKVLYPFGYGLNYTKTELKSAVGELCGREDCGAVDCGREDGGAVDCGREDGGAVDCSTEACAGGGVSSTGEDGPISEKIKITATVANIGKTPGREVVQVYCEAPQGKLGKPKKVLVGFGKTRELNPGEQEEVVVKINPYYFSSYDDRGKIAKSAYVLEAGEYKFHVGFNVRDTREIDFVYRVSKDRIVEQLSEKCAPHQLHRRMLSDGSFEEIEVDDFWTRPAYNPEILPIPGQNPIEDRWPDKESEWMPKSNPKLIDVYEGRMTLDEFMGLLSNEQKISLLGGQPNRGVANTWGIGNIAEFGIPNVMTADGPQGLRIAPACGVNTTAFPCAMLMACTWDTELVTEVNRAGALEVKENGIGMWLTPAICIHRTPLCGRNFEYYSEDPFLAGAIATACVNGIQSRGVSASVKHFACNNKETNRKESDSRLSERALREIYLKAFEICVKNAQPWTIMSSYNMINAVRSSQNRELLTDILRGEWGYEGLVTTDWSTDGEHTPEINAGNDVKMPTGMPKACLEDLRAGRLSQEALDISARRVVQMILKLD